MCDAMRVKTSTRSLYIVRIASSSSELHSSLRSSERDVAKMKLLKEHRKVEELEANAAKAAEANRSAYCGPTESERTA
jgi:hypothetical protein